MLRTCYAGSHNVFGELGVEVFKISLTYAPQETWGSLTRVLENDEVNITG